MSINVLLKRRIFTGKSLYDADECWVKDSHENICQKQLLYCQSGLDAAWEGTS